MREYKIGVFDSGLGGLTVLRGLIKVLPEYDYLFLGDTANLPYGMKSAEKIYELTLKAVDFLFKRKCYLVILACHTASAQTLRRIQREHLPQNYPARRVLGVTIPLCEAISENSSGNTKVGVLATEATCAAKSFERELKKINPRIKVFCRAASPLVPIIERGKLNQKKLNFCLENYLGTLLEKRISILALGCTHFPLVKKQIEKIIDEKIVEKKIKIFSADEVVPEKLKDYFVRHPEIEEKISKQGKRDYLLSDLDPEFERIAKKFLGTEIKTKLAKIN